MPNAFARAAFVGNRGSGKSTFLLHLEDWLEKARVFTTLHIYLDPSLETDCDYSDLLLWMVDEVAREFERRGHPVDAAELSKVTLCIDGLLDLVGRRLSLDLVFEIEKVARFLVEKSGGYIRDLIRLLDEAQLEAQVDGKERVDLASAKSAVKKLSVNFTRHLLPGSVYYPILAEVHSHQARVQNRGRRGYQGARRCGA